MGKSRSFAKRTKLGTEMKVWPNVALFAACISWLTAAWADAQGVAERVQQIGIQTEQGNLVAETHYCNTCATGNTDWGALEGYLKAQVVNSSNLNVLLLYNDRSQCPDLGGLLFSLGGADRLTRATADHLFSLLSPNCMAVYWRMGNRGAFIQNPAQRIDQLREQLEPLFR